MHLFAITNWPQLTFCFGKDNSALNCNVFFFEPINLLDCIGFTPCLSHNPGRITKWFLKYPKKELTVNLRNSEGIVCVRMSGVFFKEYQIIGKPFPKLKQAIPIKHTHTHRTIYFLKVTRDGYMTHSPRILSGECDVRETTTSRSMHLSQE